MADQDNKAAAPPYVAFKTFWNFLDKLGQIGTPPRIDRSVWGDSLSGAYGSQLMAALRFLGLIDSDGYAEPDLRPVAENVETRKAFLKECLPKAYRPVFDDIGALAEFTPAQLEEDFREAYKISGATLTKAISFLVHAAKAAEIPISPYIERKTRQRTVTGKTRRKAKGQKASTRREPVQGQQEQKSGDLPERIVTLQSGGTVRVSLDYNPFKLSDKDRTFVYGLIDMIREYEGGDA